jgi:deoxyhypusine synthase
MTTELGPVSQFLKHNFRHFNAASLIDAAEGWTRISTAAAR